MRILVVEDEARSYRELEEAVRGLDHSIELRAVDSRRAACELLHAEEFDFVVCNLHLPEEPGGAPALEHGLAVYECASRALPGTPTMLLTGSGDERAARARIAARPAADVFGTGEPYPMSDLIYKHEPQEYAERIAEVATQLGALERIEIQPAARDLTLSTSQARALRIFARRHGANRIEIMRLGGLSDSLALRTTLFTNNRTFIAAVFAKLEPLEAVAREAERYHAAALRLPAGSYAPLLDVVDAGAGRSGGLYYGLADRHQDTLFSHLLEHPDGAAEVVTELRRVLGAWRDGSRATEEVLITTLRRERASSADIEPFTAALAEGWQEFERRSVAVLPSLQHGDLHGANVLIGESAMPLLIDFANVAEFPSCFDPVALELSLVFHPESPLRGLSWPTLEQCARWDDLDAYLEGCIAPDFVRACREWALGEAASPATAYAVAYVEALRQLRYASSETERALAIASATVRRGLELCEGGGVP